MDSADFNALFDQEIAAPLEAIGAVRDNDLLFWESTDLTVGLLRTENRKTPSPPQLTLFVRHKAMRDLDEKLPSRLTRRPNDYPIKMLPGDAATLLASPFEYTPLNLGTYPAEVFSCPPDSPEQIQGRLAEIGKLLLATLPELDKHVTTASLLAMLVDQEKHDWCEKLWIEDLRAASA